MLLNNPELIHQILFVLNTIKSKICELNPFPAPTSIYTIIKYILVTDDYRQQYTKNTQQTIKDISGL